MHRLRILVAFALLIAAGALGTVRLLESNWFADHLRRALMTQGSAFLGDDLHIAHLGIDLAGTQISASGVEIHSRDPSRLGQQIVAVEGLSVRLRRLTWQRDLVLEEVRVERPQLRLRMEDGALSDLKGLQAYLSRPRGRPLVKVVLRRLDVVEAVAIVEASPQGILADAGGVSLSLSLVSPREGKGQLNVGSLTLAGGGYRETLSLAPGNLEIRDGRLLLHRSSLGTTLGALSLNGWVGAPPSGSASPPQALAWQLSAHADFDLSRLGAILPKDPKVQGMMGLGLEAQGGEGSPTVTAQVSLRGAKVGRLVVGDVDLRARLEKDSVVVSDLDAAYGGGKVTGELRLGLTGTLPVDARLHLEKVRLEKVLANNTILNSWVTLGISGDIRGGGELKRKGPFRLEFQADLLTRDLVVASSPWHRPSLRRIILTLPEARVRTPVQIFRDHLLLPDARVTTLRSELQTSVDFLFKKPLGLDIRIAGHRFDWADLGGVAGLRFAGEGQVDGQIVGPTRNLDIRGTASFSRLEFLNYDLGGARADISWHNREPLRITGIRAHRGSSDYQGDVEVFFGRKGAPTTLRASTRFAGADAGDLLGIVLPRIPARGVAEGEMHMEGALRTFSGEGRIRVQDAVFAGENWSEIALDLKSRDGVVTLQEGGFRKKEGGVQVRGTLDTHGSLDFQGFTYDLGLSDLDGISRLKLPLTGRARARMRLFGTLRHPRAEVDVDLPDLSFRGQRVGASALHFTLDDRALKSTGSLADGKASLEDAWIDLRGSRPYRLKARWKDLPLHYYLPPSSLAGAPVTWTLTGGVEGAGQMTLPASHDIAITVADTRLRHHDNTLRNTTPVQMRYQGRALRVDSFPLVDDLGNRLSLEGRLGPGEDLEFKVDGTFDLRLVDLFTTAFERCDARSAGLQARARGTRSRPNLDLVFSLEDASLRTRWFPHSLDLQEAKVILRNNRLTFARNGTETPSVSEDLAFRARLGGGEVRVNRAEIELAGFRPRRYDLDVECRQCTVRYPSFLPIATGDARLQFTGTAPHLTLRGDIDVSDMTLRDSIDWQTRAFAFRNEDKVSSRKEERSPLFRLDLRLHTQDGFRMNNNFGTARASGDLRIIGDTNRIGVEGGGAALEGQIRFKGHDFDLTGGTYRFEDPFALNPQFNLTLETRVETPEQDYEITYEMLGTLARYTFLARSDPSLSEADINALLLFGVTSNQLLGEDAGVEGALSTLGSQAASLLFGAAGEAAVGAYKGNVDPRLESVLPDQIEVVPVYSTTGQASATRLVLSKELVRDRLQGKVGLTVVGKDALSGVTLRADLRVMRGFYLVGTWSFGESSDLFKDLPLQPGQGSLDFRLKVEAP